MADKMIKLYTIQHTGTFFFKDLLKKNNIKFNYSHLGEGIKALPGDITLCTIRDPEQTYISTRSRGRYITDFEKHRFAQSWKELNELWLKSNTTKTFFIPIDLPEKQQYLDALSKELGKEIKTDWEPIGHRRHKNVSLIDLSSIYNLPVVKAFYGKSKAKTIKENDRDPGPSETPNNQEVQQASPSPATITNNPTATPLNQIINNLKEKQNGMQKEGKTKTKVTTKPAKKRGRPKNSAQASNGDQ
jgi:hypothetical protein